MYCTRSARLRPVTGRIGMRFHAKAGTRGGRPRREQAAQESELCTPSMTTLPSPSERTLVAAGAAAACTLLLLAATAPAAVPSENELMLHHATPVRIALKRNQPSGRFSRWRCVGGLEDVENFEHRACVFEDVCYDVAASDFLFYTRSGNGTSAPVIFDHRRGSQHKFRQRVSDGDPVDADFVPLSKWVAYRQRHSWSPRVVAGPVPARHRALDGLTALSAPFVPTNLGHVAWDEAFPLLVAMAQLGVYTPRLRILRTHGCEVLPKESSRRVSRNPDREFAPTAQGSGCDT